MKNYEIRLYAVEAKGEVEWNAIYPDVFGCGGAGNTPEEALADAKESLEAHLKGLEEENLPVPEAKMKNNEYSGKFTLRISSNSHREAVRNAELEGISLNQYIAEAVAEKNGRTRAFIDIKNSFNFFSITDGNLNNWYTATDSDFRFPIKIERRII